VSVEILTLTILGFVFFVIAKCEYIFSFFGRAFAKLTSEHTQQFITVLVSYGISLVAISQRYIVSVSLVNIAAMSSVSLIFYPALFNE